MQGVDQSNRVCVRYKGKGKQDQLFLEKNLFRKVYPKSIKTNNERVYFSFI